MAEGRRLRRGVQRVELVAAGEGHHQARQEKTTADAGDVQPDSRHRFSDRTERNIIPLLKAGAVVLCDRYIYTAFARDASRGMDPDWLRELYAFAVKPTIAFYFRVPLEVAMKRINDARAGFKFYEAGMDLGLSDDPDESFRLFQGRILEEYEKMVPEFGLTVIDATLPIETQQQQMRQLVLAKLTQARQLRVTP